MTGLPRILKGAGMAELNQLTSVNGSYLENILNNYTSLTSVNVNYRINGCYKFFAKHITSIVHTTKIRVSILLF